MTEGAESSNRRPAARSRWIAGLILLLAGCGGGGGGPTAPEPAATPASAGFELSGAGYDETVSLVDGANLVFCRQNGSTPAIWVRMAVDRAANGESSMHIDLDICEIQGGGTHSPKEPAGGVCTGGKTWEIWFHDGPEATFTNTALSQPCQLSIADTDGRYGGSFNCRGMIERSSGNRTLDVVNGSFSCSLR